MRKLAPSYEHIKQSCIELYPLSKVNRGQRKGQHINFRGKKGTYEIRVWIKREIL